MRVSTNMIYSSGLASIQSGSASLLRTQQQVASGRKILSPSDDPVGSVRTLEVTQSKELNAQFQYGQGVAKDTLSLVESRLSAVTDNLTYIRERVVAAGNSVLSQDDRKAIAKDLRARFDELVGLANSQNGEGEFLFAGLQGDTQPFSGNVDSGVSYHGDDGTRSVRVSPSRYLAVTNSGSELFMRARSGNGTFTTSAATSNTGSGIIDSGTVTDPTLITGHSYQISFALSGSTLTYQVVDQSTSATVSTGNYTDGAEIAFDGMSLSIKGTPSATDTFDVAPSTEQSVFATVSDLISTLETGGSTQVGNAIGTALTNLDNATESVLRVHASVGSRLTEIESLESVSEDLDAQYAQVLSSLNDLDYAEALTRLSQQQTVLEAAQKSFMQISRLSLFNYL